MRLRLPRFRGERPYRRHRLQNPPLQKEAQPVVAAMETFLKTKPEERYSTLSQGRRGGLFRDIYRERRDGKTSLEIWQEMFPNAEDTEDGAKLVKTFTEAVHNDIKDTFPKVFNNLLKQYDLASSPTDKKLNEGQAKEFEKVVIALTGQAPDAKSEEGRTRKLSFSSRDNQKREAAREAYKSFLSRLGDIELPNDNSTRPKSTSSKKGSQQKIFDQEATSGGGGGDGPFTAEDAQNYKDKVSFEGVENAKAAEASLQDTVNYYVGNESGKADYRRHPTQRQRQFEYFLDHVIAGLINQGYSQRKIASMLVDYEGEPLKRWRVRSAVYRQGLNYVPPPQYITIERMYFQGYEVQEIADSLKTSKEYVTDVLQEITGLAEAAGFAEEDAEAEAEARRRTASQRAAKARGAKANPEDDFDPKAWTRDRGVRPGYDTWDPESLTRAEIEGYEEYLRRMAKL